MNLARVSLKLARRGGGARARRGGRLNEPGPRLTNGVYHLT
jgi:hypothetical protein